MRDLSNKGKRITKMTKILNIAKSNDNKDYVNYKKNMLKIVRKIKMS